MKEFSLIDDYIFETFVSLLAKYVPQYKLKDNSFLKDDGIYLFMNDFSTSLAQEFIKDQNSDFVNKSFDFINAVGESYNLEILNIVDVGILEILYTTEELDRELVSKKLSEKLRVSYNNFSKYYI